MVVIVHEVVIPEIVHVHFVNSGLIFLSYEFSTSAESCLGEKNTSKK